MSHNTSTSALRCPHGDAQRALCVAASFVWRAPSLGEGETHHDTWKRRASLSFVAPEHDRPVNGSRSKPLEQQWIALLYELNSC